MLNTILIVFTFDHLIFAVYLWSDGMSFGCINDDIEVNLWSDLFVRLSYYIQLGYVKKFLSHLGIDPPSFRLWAVYPAPRPER